ncbi:MAG: hypothetical protein JRF72_11350 [Deltaproteobacteria bacterium]|nr:hypothetical protein [Deltaproteobacteria bacterium]
MKRRKLCRWLMVLFCLFFSGCTMKSVDTSESGGDEEGLPRILIACQKTKFKRYLVSEIRTTLQEKSVYIKIIDVKSLRNESTENYHAVVIINKCMAGRPDPRVEDFITAVPEKHKIILLTTGIMDSWKPESSEIDAMTSASSLSESTRIAQIITDKVEHLIDSKRM